MSTHLFTHTHKHTHALNNSTSVFVCLWDSIKYRPFPIQKTSPILENKALCISVVTGHAIGRKYFDSNTFIKQAFKKQNNWVDFPSKISLWIFHWVFGLWFLTLYCIKIKITWVWVPNVEPKAKTRRRILKDDFNYQPYLYY